MLHTETFMQPPFKSSHVTLIVQPMLVCVGEFPVNVVFNKIQMSPLGKYAVQAIWLVCNGLWMYSVALKKSMLVDNQHRVGWHPKFALF